MGDICSAPKIGLDVFLLELLIGGVIGGGLITPIYGSKLGDIYSTPMLFAVSASIAVGGLVLIGLLQDLDEFMTGMDPNEILSKCKFSINDEKNLEEAYSLATKRAYTLFVNFLVSWILLGAINGLLIYYGPPHWLTTLSIGLFSLLSFVSFVLWIISYLRYRDYSKKLLVIQLKKNEKAEISIKI